MSNADHKELKKHNLPDGDYTGRVYILAGVVEDKTSLDYGRKTFEAEITLLDNDKQTIKVNRVLSPHYLANPPAPNDKEKLNKWRADSKNYFRNTLRFLEKFGVDISGANLDTLVPLIAQNNMSCPIVRLTVNDGVPTIHNLIERLSPEVLKDDLPTMPDGNDIPLI